jgi:hypothetical protein
MNTATPLCLLLLLAAAGCGTAPAASDAGVAPCDGSTCEGEAPPESVCLEHVAADQWDDGCGVFAGGLIVAGDDANPGTKDRPVRTLQRAVDLARTGRGRVFACGDGFDGPVTLPSGVDLLGGFQCTAWHWRREVDFFNAVSQLVVRETDDIGITVEPARDGDTGAADGISRVDHFRVQSGNPISVLVRSGAVVELVYSEIRSSYGYAGHRGEDGSQFRAPDGAIGSFGAAACSASVVPGGAAVMSACGDGIVAMGGKGGDGLPGEGGAGEDGVPLPKVNPERWGTGGHGDVGVGGCEHGRNGLNGAHGTYGAPGQGIGRISEAGWEGGKAGDGSPGAPGGGGGGGGGRRGGLALCGDGSKGGAAGGAGGSGGCGGQGGKGGENGHPSIGLLVLHAKVTLRDTHIVTLSAGPGGDGGKPQDGGHAGRLGFGGSFDDDDRYGCSGGEGGYGGYGGYGGGGRGGDSIGIAYLDEDLLEVGEGVTFELGEPGKGGRSLPDDLTKSGPPGVVHEMFRFPQ